jgi:hypothetical protein
MRNLEQYIAMAKTAKDFTKQDDAMVRFPDVAKAHINGLADMILRLSVEVKSLADALDAAENDA